MPKSISTRILEAKISPPLAPNPIGAEDGAEDQEVILTVFLTPEVITIEVSFCLTAPRDITIQTTGNLKHPHIYEDGTVCPGNTFSMIAEAGKAQAWPAIESIIERVLSDLNMASLVIAPGDWDAVGINYEITPIEKTERKEGK